MAGDESARMLIINSEECHQFFKIFLPHDASTQLRIPPAFLKYFKGSLPLKFILVTSSRKSWEVVMNKFDDEVYLKDGWEKFVQDNSLEFGDFLIFYYDGGSNFYVSISGKNNCLKEIDQVENCKSEKQPIHIEENEPAGTAEQKTVSGEESKLSFEVRIQQRYMTRGYIPMPQVFYDGVKEYRGMAKLQHQDRTWDVKVDKYGERIQFNEGWSKFSAENCLGVIVMLNTTQVVINSHMGTAYDEFLHELAASVMGSSENSKYGIGGVGRLASCLQ